MLNKRILLASSALAVLAWQPGQAGGGIYLSFLGGANSHQETQFDVARCC